MLRKLNWPATALRPLPGEVEGVIGSSPAVVQVTTIKLWRQDGPPFTLCGEFVAFTDPQSTNLSLLGRDILSGFDVILSQKRDEVLLLAPIHRSTVMED